MIIDVTAEDIQKAREARQQLEGAYISCPIAQAVRRTFPEAQVGYYSLFLDQETPLTLTKVMQEFITAWDQEQKAEPRKFRLPYKAEASQ